jgi:hypothetical protein
VRPFASREIVLVGTRPAWCRRSPGRIHSALRSGRAAGLAIAGHLLDGGPSPARALAGAYRGSAVKWSLRIGLDMAPPNALIDLALDSRWFRALAQTVFFHHRGLLSPAAWHDLVRSAAAGHAT